MQSFFDEVDEQFCPHDCLRCILASILDCALWLLIDHVNVNVSVPTSDSDSDSESV